MLVPTWSGNGFGGDWLPHSRSFTFLGIPQPWLCWLVFHYYPWKFGTLNLTSYFFEKLQFRSPSPWLFLFSWPMRDNSQQFYWIRASNSNFWWWNHCLWSYAASNFFECFRFVALSSLVVLKFDCFYITLDFDELRGQIQNLDDSATPWLSNFESGDLEAGHNKSGGSRQRSCYEMQPHWSLPCYQQVSPYA